jgi:hypothetical protein
MMKKIGSVGFSMNSKGGGGGGVKLIHKGTLIYDACRLTTYLLALSWLDIDLVDRMQHDLVLCLRRCSRMTLRSKLYEINKRS